MTDRQRVLECFGASRPLLLAEVVELTDIPLPSVRVYLSDAVRDGLLSREERGVYVVRDGQAPLSRAVRFVIPLRLQHERKRNVPLREKGGAIKTVRRVDVPEAAEWKAMARVFAMQAMEGRLAFDEPVGVDLLFYRARPKSTRKQVMYPMTRPDRSNYLKLAEDALNGVCYTDDALICDGRTAKLFGDPERVEVRIWPLQDDWPYDKREKEGNDNEQ